MRNVLTFSKNPSYWASLLEEYFSEVAVNFAAEKESSAMAGADLLFAEPSFLTLALTQKIRSAKNLSPDMRVIGLGGESAPRAITDLFDVILPEACGLFDMTKKLSEKLPLPERVKLLVADDDADILTMVADYFEGRQQPIFEVTRVSNGLEAWEVIQKERPDAVILDIKMPVMKGSEVYAKMQKLSEKIPTLIFFDAISSGDLDLVKKSGAPVIVEKGYRESSMPYLMALIKKLIYFSGK